MSSRAVPFGSILRCAILVAAAVALLACGVSSSLCSPDSSSSPSSSLPRSSSLMPPSLLSWAPPPKFRPATWPDARMAATLGTWALPRKVTGMVSLSFPTSVLQAVAPWDAANM